MWALICCLVPPLRESVRTATCFGERSFLLGPGNCKSDARVICCGNKSDSHPASL